MMMNEFMGNLLLISGITGVLICLAALASPRLLKRYSARWRYYVWLVLAIRLLLPLDLSIPGRAAQIPVPAVVYQETAAIPPAYGHEGSQNGSEGGVQPAKEPVMKQSGQQPEPDRAGDKALLSSNWSHVKSWLAQYGLFAIWLAGMAVMAVWYGIGYLTAMKKIKRFCRRAGDSVASEVKKQLKELDSVSFKHSADSLRKRHAVDVYVCSCMESPMAAGLINSAVYIPSRQYSAEELAFILRHECVHIARKDLWYQAVLMLVKIMHWFNPAVYLMAGRAKEDMELVCDETVAENMDREQRFRYNRLLLAAAGGETPSAAKVPISTQFHGDFKTLKTRITRMMAGKPKRSGLALAMVFFCTVLAASLFVACRNVPDETPDAGSQIGTSHTLSDQPDPVQPKTSAEPLKNPGDPADPNQVASLEYGILLAKEGDVQYCLKQWTEEDKQKEAYIKGGSNYPVQWLGKLVKIADGAETVLYDLVDYEAVKSGSIVFAGDRIVFYGSSGYDTVAMKTLTYISMDKNGKELLFYEGKPWITSQVFYDNGYLYFESFDGETDDNHYPRKVMRMSPVFSDVQEAAQIDGLFITVKDGKVYYVASEQAEKPGVVYALSLDKNEKPIIYDKIGYSASTAHWSDVSGVQLTMDMLDRAVYEYWFTQDIGEDPVLLNLEIAKDFDISELAVLRGPALVLNESVYVFAQESEGRFFAFEPLFVGMPKGVKVNTGDYVELYYNGNVLESYPGQIYAEIVRVGSNPASFQLPETLSMEQAAESGCYVTGSGAEVRNEGALTQFVSAASETGTGIPVFMRQAFFDENQKPYLMDIYYTGKGFTITEDSLRVDGKKDVTVRNYQYMNVMDDGALIILSNEKELTKQEFERRMFSSQLEDTIDFFFLKQ